MTCPDGGFITQTDTHLKKTYTYPEHQSTNVEHQGFRGSKSQRQNMKGRSPKIGMFLIAFLDELDHLEAKTKI